MQELNKVELALLHVRRTSKIDIIGVLGPRSRG